MWSPFKTKNSRSRLLSRSPSSRAKFLSGCEQLEDRRMLAITAEFAAGVLTFTGDGADNELTITAADNTSTTVSFTSATDTITLVGATTNPQAGITSIVVDLAGGNDELRIMGSAQDDTIAVNGLTVTFGVVPYSMNAAVDNLLVEGQGGVDIISATGNSVSGDLLLFCGAGNDAVSVQNLTVGEVRVDGGGDADTITVNSGVTATSGAIFFLEPVTLAGPTTFTANGSFGGVNFSSTIDGANAMTINSSGGTTFGGAVGGITPLSSLDVTGARGDQRRHGGHDRRKTMPGRSWSMQPRIPQPSPAPI